MTRYRELIVDNFAGGGGASTGIQLALGRSPDIAIDHDPQAMAMHRANHPTARHLIEDVFAVNPREVTGGKPVALAWFSPDCKHFSKARGGKPVSKKIRGLAWAAVRWAKEARPRVLVLENVGDFQDWGPLLPDGYPDPSRRGLTFRRFVGCLRGQGYDVDWLELVAADFGAPTTRKRLFLIARNDGRPIVWPEPTHSDPKAGPDLFSAERKPWRTAAECIDWSIPCPSIFERRRPLAEKTMRRIAEGVRRYVVECTDPFVIPPIDHEAPPRLLAAHVQKFYGGVVGSDARDPVSTVTAVDHNAVCAAFLSKFYGTNVGRSLREPAPTITSGGNHVACVRAFLMKYYGCGIGQSVLDPIHTIRSKECFGLVTIHGEPYQIADIGLRMLTPRELANAQGFPSDYVMTGTTTSQLARIGNSVCPPVAEAIVRANLPELAIPSSS